jgi:hypothetical protein
MLSQALECPDWFFQNRLGALECPITAFQKPPEALECPIVAFQKVLRHWSAPIVIQKRQPAVPGCQVKSRQKNVNRLWAAGARGSAAQGLVNGCPQDGSDRK